MADISISNHGTLFLFQPLTQGTLGCAITSSPTRSGSSPRSSSSRGTPRDLVVGAIHAGLRVQ